MTNNGAYEMTSTNKKYIVNWDDIKFTTNRDETHVFCILEFDEKKYTLDYSRDKIYYPTLFGNGYWRMVPRKRFILEKEKEFIKSLIITRAYYEEVLWLKKEHKL